MSIIATFQPNEETEQQFKLESGISIKRARNKSSTATVSLPNNFTTRNMNGYGTLRIDLNDVNLFDGKTQGRSFSKFGVTFNANDWLWDFGRKKRSFFQNTDMRPDEAFTEAFDNGTDFGNYLGYWDTYPDAWITGFNATKNIVPADSSQFSEYFDGENKTGIDFMKFVADSAYKGDRYKYFYWYQYINGTKSLFFQPDGWGKTWKNLNFTVASLKENIDNVYNNITVWGKRIQGSYPHGGDYWTEDNLDGWNVVNQGLFTYEVTLSSTESIVGEQSLKFIVVAGDPGDYGRTFRDFREAGNDYINLETLIATNLKFYISFLVTEFTVQADFRLEDSTGKTAIETLDLSTTGSWVTLSIPDTSWGGITEGFDWSKVSKIDFDISCDTGSDRITIYIDGFYFDRAPIKSQNISITTGYDATSESNYGYREFTVNNPWVKYVADCNTFATNLMNYYKDPQYTTSVDIDGFVPINLNDNVYGNFYGNLLTLPVNSITWNFKEKEWTTKLGLGQKRMEPSDLLGKLFEDVESDSFDRGLTYNVF